jgi:hypothetical protein
MAVIKCPNCGHRHLQAVPLCINCGAPLPTEMERAQPVHTSDNMLVVPSSRHESASRNSDIDSYEHFLAESAAHRSSETHNYRAQPATTRQLPESPTTTTTSRQLVRRDDLRPVPHQTWKKKTEVQLYTPYETSVSITPPDPLTQTGLTVREDSAAEVVQLDRWKQDKLPWYFVKTRPTIAGTVIYMESKEEIIDYPDFFAAIVTLLVSLIWIMTDTVQEKESDRVVMTTVRVKTDQGQLKDTRLRGNMRGANLSLGDYVSLWGFKHRGVLFVRRGFNHTTQGVISTSAMGVIVPALLITVAALLAVYLVPALFTTLWHHLLSTISSYFSLLHHSVTPKK